jgi:hypothetical protein
MPTSDSPLRCTSKHSCTRAEAACAIRSPPAQHGHVAPPSICKLDRLRSHRVASWFLTLLLRVKVAAGSPRLTIAASVKYGVHDVGNGGGRPEALLRPAQALAHHVPDEGLAQQRPQRRRSAGGSNQQRMQERLEQQRGGACTPTPFNLARPTACFATQERRFECRCGSGGSSLFSASALKKMWSKNGCRRSSARRPLSESRAAAHRRSPMAESSGSCASGLAAAVWLRMRHGCRPSPGSGSVRSQQP